MNAALEPGPRDGGWMRRMQRRLIRPIDDDVGQGLLEALRVQAVRIPIPVTLMALVVVWLGKDTVPAVAQIVWLISVAVLQGLRYVRLSGLPRETDRAAEDRLYEATVLSAINGIVVGASAAFYPYLSEFARCVHSMIMIGTVTGGVATSHGYRPLFLAFVGPVLAGVMIAWLAVPAPGIGFEAQLGVALLVFLLGLILNALASDSFRSFTEAFRINAEIKRALRAEQSANNAKTRFLAAASHDLRQPLQSLSMFSAALARRDLDAKTAEIAVSIKEAVNDLTSELDALLDISKLDAGVVKVNREPINLSLFVQRVVGSTRSLAEAKGLDVRVELLASPWVESDRVLLERVLRNLIDNAIKYTIEGSITVSVSLSAEGCQLSVRDTGVGIAAAEHGRVFEEFYQLGNIGRDRRKGLGLGLSIVGRLVQLLDGQVTVRSVVSQGSVFTVTLPCSQPVREPAAVAETVLPPKLDGVVVLLIEDEPGVRLGTRLLLEGLGCAVLEAGSTAEALAVLDGDAVPDLVLADIRLPDGDDGFKAVRQVRMRLPRLPVVLVSGETSPERLRDADRIGAPLLVKPVDEASLVGAIVHALGAD
ncbi:MAG: hybrid sensor histidine kinase/response regulator [Burkholderiaceae bacterium]